MIENVSLSVDDVFGASGLNYADLMTQDQCVSIINQLQQANGSTGWIILVLAALVGLLSLLLILQQKRIKELVKKKNGKR